MDQNANDRAGAAIAPARFVPRPAPHAPAQPRARRSIWLFLLPSLLIFLLYRIIPLVWNVVLSLEFWSPYKPARFAGLYHYQNMLFYDDAFWKVFWNTLVFMASAPFGIALALGVALLVNTPIRGRGVYRTIVFMSYPVMTVAVGIIWQWLYNEKVGLINYVLISLGIIDKGIPFLESFSWALPAVILASLWQVIGFYMIILLTGLQSIPPNLYEAASIDGASARQQLLAHHRAAAQAVALPLLCRRHHQFLQRLRPHLRHDGRRAGPRDRPARHLHLLHRLQARAFRLCRGDHGGQFRALRRRSPSSPTGSPAARPAP